MGLSIDCTFRESETRWAGAGRLDVDSPLMSEKIQIERKQFFFDLKENPRGRFLRITEDVGGRRDAIVIPSTGLESFRDAIEHAMAADRQTAVTVAAE
jgi:hypothetical protein